MAARQFGAAWLVGSADFELPATGVSIKAVLEFLRRVLGRQPTRIIGEVVLLAKDSIQVTIRIADSPQETNVGKLKDLDYLLLQSAKYIYKISQPYILASFLNRASDDKSSCLEMIQYCLANDPPEDDVWAYNLWGRLLHIQGNYPEAIEKYKKAIELDPKFQGAYYNWGNLLQRQNKYPEATEKYIKATEIDPKFANAYNNWGNALRKLNKYPEAIEKYEKFVELAPQSLDSFVQRAREKISLLKESVAAK